MDLSKFGNHTSPSKFHPKFLTHPLQTLHDQTHIYGNTNSFSKYYAKSEEFRGLIRKVKQYSVASWLHLQRLWYTNHTSRCIESDVHKVLFETTRFFGISDLDRVYFLNPNGLNIFSSIYPNEITVESHRTSIQRTVCLLIFFRSRDSESADNYEKIGVQVPWVKRFCWHVFFAGYQSTRIAIMVVQVFI